MAILGLTDQNTVPALVGYQRTGESIAASEIRLTTGQRIAQGDEANASVAAATTLSTQNSTLRSALQNGANAASLLQVASNGLDQIKTILESLSALTATANQTGITTRQYTTLNGQFQSQLAAIDGIVASTTYNGATLLDGSADLSGAPVYQLGSEADSTLDTAIPNVTSASLFPTAVSLGNHAGATTATIQVGNAQDSIDTAMAKVEAYQSRLAEAEDAARASIAGVTNAFQDITGIDPMAEMQQRASQQLQQDRGAAVIAQAMNLNQSLLGLVY